jgi:hypothetical protein
MRPQPWRKVPTCPSVSGETERAVERHLSFNRMFTLHIRPIIKACCLLMSEAAMLPPEPFFQKDRHDGDDRHETHLFRRLCSVRDNHFAFRHTLRSAHGAGLLLDALQLLISALAITVPLTTLERRASEGKDRSSERHRLVPATVAGRETLSFLNDSRPNSAEVLSRRITHLRMLRRFAGWHVFASTERWW